MATPSGSEPSINLSPAEIERIEVDARLWHDNRPGNTYHSAKVTIREETGDTTVWHTGMRYGYDQAYEQTVQDLLEHLGVAEPEKYDNGFQEPFWQQMKRLEIEVDTQETKVGSRSDLHDGSGPRGFRNLERASEQKRRIDR